jgi:hypothetical protein
VVAVIGVLAAITIRQQDRIADLQAQNGRVIEVITAPDAGLVYVPVATGGRWDDRVLPRVRPSRGSP